MASKKRRARMPRKVSRRRRNNNSNRWDITKQPRLFKTAESRTLQEFLIASIIGGITGGLGFAIGNSLLKWATEETNKVVPLPESFLASVRNNYK